MWHTRLLNELSGVYGFVIVIFFVFLCMATPRGICDARIPNTNTFCPTDILVVVLHAFVARATAATMTFASRSVR